MSVYVQLPPGIDPSKMERLVSKLEGIVNVVEAHPYRADEAMNELSGTYGTFVTRLKERLTNQRKFHEQVLVDLRRYISATRTYAGKLVDAENEFRVHRSELYNYPGLLGEGNRLRNESEVFPTEQQTAVTPEETEALYLRIKSYGDVRYRIENRVTRMYWELEQAAIEYAEQCRNCFANIRNPLLLERIYDNVTAPVINWQYTVLTQANKFLWKEIVGTEQGKEIVDSVFSGIDIGISAYERGVAQHEYDVLYPEVEGEERAVRVVVAGAGAFPVAAAGEGAEKFGSSLPGGPITGYFVGGTAEAVVEPLVDAGVSDVNAGVHRVQVSRDVYHGIRAEGTPEALSPLVGTRSAWLNSSQASIDDAAQKLAGTGREDESLLSLPRSVVRKNNASDYLKDFE